MRKIAAILVALLIVVASCDSGINEEPRRGMLVDLGGHHLSVERLVVHNDLLYALAGNKGLWRINVDNEKDVWSFVGLDSSIYNDSSGRPSDLLIRNNGQTLLASLVSRDPKNHSVYRSTDGGQVWEPSDEEMAVESNGDTVYFQINSLIETNGFVIADGFFVSSDLGESWAPANSLPISDSKVAAVHPLDRSIIWMGGRKATDEPSMAYSVDSGNSWISVDDQLRDIASQKSVVSIGLSATNKDLLYLGLSDILIRSEDRGSTWAVVTTGPASYSHPSLVVHGSDDETIYAVRIRRDASQLSELIVSKDNGKIWSTIDESANISPTTIVWAGDALFVGTDSGIYKYYPE